MRTTVLDLNGEPAVILPVMPNRATGLPWDRLQASPREQDDADAPSARPRLSTQAIVDTAIAIADVDGLDAVSIRRVAAILEVRPMSLYTHIVSKDELFALMADELVGMLLVDAPLPGDWRKALTVTSRRMFRTFVSHPWLLALFTRRPRPGPNTAQQTKQSARAVEGLRLPPEDMWRLLGIVNDYVVGNALRVATSPAGRDLVAYLSELEGAEQLELAALRSFEEARLADESFEIGLRVVLDGLERRFVRGRR
jgi:AcrR family transcriptional regulator